MRLVVAFIAGVVVAGVIVAVLFFAPIGSLAELEYPAYEPSEYAVGFVPPEHRNAAVAYGKQASMMIAVGRFIDILPNRDVFAAGGPYAPEKLDDLRMGTQIAELFRGATKLRRCDWEQSLELGYHGELPELNFLLTIFKLFVVAGDLASNDGDLDAAIKNYAAALRVSEHMGQTGIILMGKVAAGNVLLVTARVARRIDMTRVGSESKEEWNEAIDRFDSVDPFGFRSGIDVIVEWTTRLTGFEIAHAERFSQGGFDGITVPDEPIVPRSAADRAMVETMMRNARRWKTDILAAWDAEEDVRVERVRKVGTGVGQGEYGEQFPKVLFPLENLPGLEIEATRALAESRIQATQGSPAGTAPSP